MTTTSYRLVVTTRDGVTKGDPPLSRDAALAAFDAVHLAPGFRPDGGGRARVVDEQTWLAIEATAARAAR